MKIIVSFILFGLFGSLLFGQSLNLNSAFKIDNAETAIDYLFTNDPTEGILYFSHKGQVPMFDNHIPDVGADVSIYQVGVDFAEYAFSIDGGVSDVYVLAIGDNEENSTSYILASLGKECRLFNDEEVLLNLSLEDSLNTIIIQGGIFDLQYSLISAPENLIYKITPYANGTLISGSFTDSLVYTSPAKTVSTYSNNSTYNGFLLSINEFGEVQWVHLSPTIGYSLVRTVAVADSIILFPHDVLFGTQFSLIDFNGNTISSSYLQGISIQHIEQNAQGNIGMCGNYYTSGGTADMDFGSGMYEMPTAIAKDAFLNMYDKDLNLSWSQVISGKEIDTGTNFDYDDDGGIYLTGCIQSDGIFDGGSDIYEAVGAEDIFISHYNADGSYNRTNTFGGDGTDVGLNVVAQEGDVILSGIFRESMDINPSDSLSQILEDTNDDYDAAFFYAVFEEEVESGTINLEKQELSVSPNPTSNFLNFDKTLVGVRIYSESGKLVLGIDSPVQQVDVSSLSAGVYFIKGKDKQGKKYNVAFYRR